MAGEVQELLIRYTSDISQLQSQASQLEQEFRKVSVAAEASSKAIETTLNKQAALIQTVTNRLVQLQQARDKAAGEGEASRLIRINDLIEQQEQRLADLRNIPPLQIISEKELGLVEQTRQTLAELAIARDKTQDTAKIALFNHLIAEQELALRKLTEIPKIEPIKPEQLGIIEQAKLKLDELRQAQLKNQDPALVQQFIAQINEQEEAVRRLTSLPPVQVVTPDQLGLVQQMRQSIEELTTARDAEQDKQKIDELNQSIANQQALLESLTKIPPPKITDASQIGIIDNIRSRIEKLTVALNKSQDPTRISRINQLLADQRQRLQELTTVRIQPVSEELKNSLQSLNKDGVNPLKHGFEELGKQLIAVFAVERIERFISESVKAFAEQQEALERLKFSITNIADGTLEDIKLLNEQAEELGQKTFFQNNLITKSQNLQAQFGLTSDRIQELTPLILELATALNLDLTEATNSVLRAIEGNSKGLKLVGGDFKDTGDQVKNYNLVIQNLSKLQGTAANALDTTAGKLRNQSKEIEQIKERIGGEFAQAFTNFSGVLLEVAEGAAVVTHNVSDMIKNLDPKLLIPIFGPLKALHDALFGVGEVTENTTEKAKELIQTLTAAAKVEFKDTSLEDLKKKLPEIVKLMNEVADARKAAIAANDTVEQQRNDRLLIDLFTQNQAIKQLIATKQQQLDLERKFTKDVSSLTKQQLTDQLTQLRALKNAGTIDVRALIDAREEALKKLEEKEKQLIQQQEQERIAASKRLKELEIKTQDDLLKTRADSDIEKIAAERQVQEQELQRTFEASQKKKADQENLDQALLNLLKIFGVKERDIIRDNEKQKAKIRQDAAQQQIDDLKNQLDSALQTIDIEQQHQTIEVNRQFTTTGDFSPAAEKRLQEQLLNIEHEFNIKRIEERKRFVEKFIDENEKLFQAIEDSANADKKAASEKLFDSGGLFNISKLAQFGKDIVKIDTETNKVRKALGKDVSDTLNKTEKEITEITGDESSKRQEIVKDEALKRIELENKIVDTVINGAADILTNSAQVRADAQIKSIEEIRDAHIDAIDKQIEANKKLADNDALSAKDARIRNDELLKRKKEAEERSAKAISAIKRRQFQQDQFAAIGKIAINTAVNIAKDPELTALYLLLAATETGVVLAQPNPYKKGSKKTKEGLAIVGEEGPELMQMPAGAKVLPNKQTVKHASMIDAMFDNRMDEHVHKVFVEPALKEQAKKLALSEEFIQRNPVVSQMLMEIQVQKRDSLTELVERLVNRVNVDREINSSLYERFDTEQIVERIANAVQRFNSNSFSEVSKSITKAVSDSSTLSQVKEMIDQSVSTIVSKSVAHKISDVVSKVVANETKLDKSVLVNSILSEVHKSAFMFSAFNTRDEITDSLMAHVTKQITKAIEVSTTLKEANNNVVESINNVASSSVVNILKEAITVAISKEKRLNKQTLTSKILNEINKNKSDKSVFFKKELSLQEIIRESLQKKQYLSAEDTIKQRLKNTVQYIHDDIELSSRSLNKQNVFSVIESMHKVIANNESKLSRYSSSSSVERSYNALKPRITFSITPQKLNADLYKALLNVPLEMPKVEIGNMLKTVSHTYQVEREKAFADSVANSFIINTAKAMTAREADDIRRRGTYIRNLEKEVTEPLIEKLDSLLRKPSYKR